MKHTSTRFNALAAVFAVLCIYQSAAVLDAAGVIDASVIRPDTYTERMIKSRMMREDVVVKPSNREVKANASKKKMTPIVRKHRTK